MLDTSQTGRPPQAESAAPKTREAHFAGFDGLRAIAALTVVGVHTAFDSGFTVKHHVLGRYTSRLEIGVSVFFVISGFLLYRPYVVAHMGGRPAPSLLRFWSRRVKRIIPAYWVAFLVVCYVLHAEPVRHTWDAPFIYLGFAQIYSPNYILSGIDQAWSLCTEMTFYLMLPLYAALLGQKKRSTDRQFRVESIGLLALVAISFAYRTPVLLAHGRMAQIMPSWLPAYLDLFALGMFLAVVSSYLAAEDRRPALLWHPALPWLSWAMAALAFIAVSNIGLTVIPIHPDPVVPSLLRQSLYGVFGFFLVLPAVVGTPAQGSVRRFLSWKPIALTGVISYGIYLWHQADKVLFMRWTGHHLFNYQWGIMYAAVTTLAIGMAALSYRLVERPILRYRRSTNPGRPGHRPSAATSLVGVRP